MGSRICLLIATRNVGIESSPKDTAIVRQELHALPRTLTVARYGGKGNEKDRLGLLVCLMSSGTSM
jgi:hypothetical protein